MSVALYEYMRYIITFTAGLALTACASAKPVQDIRAYGLSDVSVVVESHFDAPKGSVARALKPSFDKFGKPYQYVTGLMSAVDREGLDRLYGTGEISQRFQLDRPVAWQIDGQALAGSLEPIAAVHLVYNLKDLGSSTFDNVSMQTRRGQSFTVFERRVQTQIIVSLYPSPALPPDAVLEKMLFE